MEWIKSSVQTTPDGVEPVLGVLFSCGINGAQIIDALDIKRFLREESIQWDYVDEALLKAENTDAFVEFYVPPDSEGREILALVRSQINILKQLRIGFDIGNLTLASESVDDDTWLHEWKKHYKPFRIGKTVVVVPVWEQYEARSGELIFTIDPGSVFGTGLHPTTQLCVEAMEEYIKPGDLMLDIGCGSGILSIIGLLLGVKHVLACDIDPAANLASHDNVLLNPVESQNITVMIGNIFTDEVIGNAAVSNPLDIIVSNIVADVIVNLTPLVKKYLKPEGLFIASGIIENRIDNVVNALTENGFNIKLKLSRDGWFCIVAVNA